MERNCPVQLWAAEWLLELKVTSLPECGRAQASIHTLPGKWPSNPKNHVRNGTQAVSQSKTLPKQKEKRKSTAYGGGSKNGTRNGTLVYGNKREKQPTA